MYKLIQTMAAAVLLAAQVASPLRVPATATAEASSLVVTKPTATYNLKINTDSPQAIELVAIKPDFDREVLSPLQAAQTAKAQAEAAAAQAAAQAIQIRLASVQIDSQSNRHIGVATGDIWEQLRICEAGGDYTRNSGNGYYGAYQYDLSTWANYGGYARPDLAPPATQDAKARETQAARGWSPWPACARKLGLL